MLFPCTCVKQRQRKRKIVSNKDHVLVREVSFSLCVWGTYLIEGEDLLPRLDVEDVDGAIGVASDDLAEV